MGWRVDLESRRSLVLACGLAALMAGVLWAAAACNNQVTPISPNRSPSETVGPQVLLKDGVYELQVDRVLASPVSGPPFEFLPESDYAPVEDGRTYRVVVSQEGAQVSVEMDRGGEHLAAQGRCATVADGRVWYEMDWYCGGRFVVWSTADGLLGELTGYGSGMPIITSGRGTLVRIPSGG